MVACRRGTSGWRTAEPSRPVVIVAEPSGASRHSRSAWRVSSLAAAACVGGLIVLAGVWTAGWLGRQDKPVNRPHVAVADRVTPEQMRNLEIEPFLREWSFRDFAALEGVFGTRWPAEFLEHPDDGPFLRPSDFLALHP